MRVTTDRGVVEAERLVLTAGAWSQDVARLPAGLVRGVRQALAWLQPTRPELFAPERFPVFNLALDGEHFYGFPVFGIPGLQARPLRPLRRGRRPGRDLARADARRRGAAARVRRALLPGRRRADDRAQDLPLRALARRALPHRPPPRRPTHVVVGAGFSGHGFKFCSVVGEILADLALDGETRHDIGFLRLARFA